MSSSRAGQASQPELPAVFAQLMDGLRATTSPTSIAIACSGGLDSMALLHLGHAWAADRGIALHAFHVHHGLSPNADAWLAHCRQACAALGIAFDCRHVEVAKGKDGLESAARKLRYRALGEMCSAHGVPLLLTAHHLDDQAETVLLQLLRGSGPAGLSGMDAANRAPALLGDPGLLMARPLLSLSRARLEAYARAAGLAWVEDESNSDPRHARNALRHGVMPALAAAFPGYQERIARGAAHVQAAQRILDEVAQQDLSACLIDDAVDLARVRQLSRDRADNMLRHLFSQRGLAMPSTAWLAEMVSQLFSAREDAQLKVTHPACDIRRHRGKLVITPKLPALAGMRDPDDAGVLVKEGQRFRWNGEACLAFPAYGGVLHFERAPQGFDPVWLRSRPLTIDFRQGGERLKPAANRPTRGLKAHYQALGVPAWERERAPLVWAAGELLFAAGIGMDCRHMVEGPGERIALRWVSDPA